MPMRKRFARFLENKDFVLSEDKNVKKDCFLAIFPDTFFCSDPFDIFRSPHE